MEFAMWALVGWCGTPPRPWPWPWPPDPWISKVIGLVGGVAGGWAYTQTFGAGGEIDALGVAAGSVGAWVGATVLSNVYGLIGGRGAQGPQ